LETWCGEAAINGEDISRKERKGRKVGGKRTHHEGDEGHEVRKACHRGHRALKEKFLCDLFILLNSRNQGEEISRKERKNRKVTSRGSSSRANGEGSKKDFSRWSK
jgi:hypothetical protein